MFKPICYAAGHEAADVHHDESDTERHVYGSIHAADKERSQLGAHVMCPKNGQQGIGNGSCGIVVGSRDAADIPAGQLLQECGLPRRLSKRQLAPFFSRVHGQSQWPVVEFTVKVGKCWSHKVRQTMWLQIFYVEDCDLAHSEAPVHCRGMVHHQWILQSSNHCIAKITINIQRLRQHGLPYFMRPGSTNVHSELHKRPIDSGHGCLERIMQPLAFSAPSADHALATAAQQEYQQHL